MFECADAAFLIGAYPSPQVGSGDAVMICGTLLAAYVQVVEYGLVVEVSCIFAHKKTAPCELEGMCPTFGVQFNFQTAFILFDVKYRLENKAVGAQSLVVAAV